MSTNPTVSCLGEMGTTPARLGRPIVGLMPTTEFKLDVHKMDPSVSVPSVTVAIFEATDMADPLLELHGVTVRVLHVSIKHSECLSYTE